MTNEENELEEEKMDSPLEKTMQPISRAEALARESQADEPGDQKTETQIEGDLKENETKQVVNDKSLRNEVKEKNNEEGTTSNTSNNKPRNKKNLRGQNDDKSATSELNSQETKKSKNENTSTNENRVNFDFISSRVKYTFRQNVYH